MEITFDCPNCKASISGTDEQVGAVLPCPACDERIMIPAPGIEVGMMLGNYRIDSLLGAGGMGEVYAATQLGLDRTVALKVLSPACLSDQNAVDRFMREMRVAGKLMHPNIVTAFDAGTENGYHYIAMTYINGTDVETILKEDKRIPEDEALTVALKIARALDHAWTQHGMLHRDLKPGNIMVNQDGEIKLMDMGLAKIKSADAGLTADGTFLGTPHYISPEQARNKDMDCRSDMYSLGATLFNMVTGQRPFRGANLMAIVAMHVSDPIPDPCTLNQELTPACGRLIEKMMAKSPDDRYPDWKALQEAIERVLAGEPETTTAPATPALPKNPATAVSRRNPTVMALAIVAIVGLIAVAVIGGWMLLSKVGAKMSSKRQPATQPAPDESKTPETTTAKPPTPETVLHLNDKALSKLRSMTAKLAEQHQYQVAAALLAKQRGNVKDAKQINSVIREYETQAGRIGPLVRHAHKAVVLCLDGKYTAARESAEESLNNDEVRTAGQKLVSSSRIIGTGCSTPNHRTHCPPSCMPSTHGSVVRPARF